MQNSHTNYCIKQGLLRKCNYISAKEAKNITQIHDKEGWIHFIRNDNYSYLPKVSLHPRNWVEYMYLISLCESTSNINEYTIQEQLKTWLEKSLFIVYLLNKKLKPNSKARLVSFCADKVLLRLQNKAPELVHS